MSIGFDLLPKNTDVMETDLPISFLEPRSNAAEVECENSAVLNGPVRYDMHSESSGVVADHASSGNGLGAADEDGGPAFADALLALRDELELFDNVLAGLQLLLRTSPGPCIGNTLDNGRCQRSLRIPGFRTLSQKLWRYWTESRQTVQKRWISNRPQQSLTV